MTIKDLLQVSLSRHAERVALIHEGLRMTYAEMDVLSDRLALRLTHQGVASGARADLLLPNGPELVLAYCACIKSGAVAAPRICASPDPSCAMPSTTAGPARSSPRPTSTPP